MRRILSCLLPLLCCLVTLDANAILILGKLEKRGAQSQSLIIHNTIGIQTFNKEYPFIKADTGYKLLAISKDSITIYKSQQFVDTDIAEEYFYDHRDHDDYIFKKRFTHNGAGYYHVRIPVAVQVYVIPQSQIVSISYYRKSLENLGCTIGCLLLPPVWIYAAIANSHPARQYNMKKWEIVPLPPPQAIN